MGDTALLRSWHSCTGMTGRKMRPLVLGRQVLSLLACNNFHQKYFLKAMSSFILNDVPHKTQNSGAFQWEAGFQKRMALTSTF